MKKKMTEHYCTSFNLDGLIYESIEIANSREEALKKHKKALYESLGGIVNDQAYTNDKGELISMKISFSGQEPKILKDLSSKAISNKKDLRLEKNRKSVNLRKMTPLKRKFHTGSEGITFIDDFFNFEFKE